jgi:hypothetical protein
MKFEGLAEELRGAVPTSSDIANHQTWLDVTSDATGFKVGFDGGAIDNLVGQRSKLYIGFNEQLLSNIVGQYLEN